MIKMFFKTEFILIDAVDIKMLNLFIIGNQWIMKIQKLKNLLKVVVSDAIVEYKKEYQNHW